MSPKLLLQPTTPLSIAVTIKVFVKRKLLLYYVKVFWKL